ncbi:hypothetical protein CspeluHIS016_0308500 [Cutaneotrichosporon spelunceum]|uniref:Ser-Thr-rich glycosyl-phosphatidyl-inositol-anchored membrane family-domain-containing protein n=1 Tax=Cutaneotrichosporon spelunceum TaxID=1672016 RepID=A0AAD3TV35_9TREE|nr:hypothetical protein CspeluHIS016_0308500 [Cutaneotrichosporon spelunceum]
MFAIALLALSGIANALTMNTPPSLVQCQPIKLTWEAGVPPFYLAVVPGGQTSAAPLVNFPTTDAMSQTWMVSLAAGTSVTIMVTDGTGEMSVTSPVTVMAGSNTDCMNASSSEVPASTPAPSGEQTPASTPGPSAILSVPASSPGAPAPVSPSAAVSSASTTVSSVSRPASSSSAVVSPSASPTSGAGRVAVGGAVAAAAGLVALAAF